jgi:hypothetical protein
MKAYADGSAADNTLVARPTIRSWSIFRKYLLPSYIYHATADDDEIVPHLWAGDFDRITTYPRSNNPPE